MSESSTGFLSTPPPARPAGPVSTAAASAAAPAAPPTTPPATAPLSPGRSRRPAVQRVKPPRVLVRMANPVVRRVLASPAHRLGSSALVLLHVRGRRTGRRYDIPVGYSAAGSTLTVLTSSRWRANLRGGVEVEVTFRGQRRTAGTSLLEDPTEVAQFYADRIAGMGWKAAQRRLGLRINVRRTPTLDELREVVRARSLAVLRLELR